MKLKVDGGRNKDYVIVVNFEEFSFIMEEEIVEARVNIRILGVV